MYGPTKKVHKMSPWIKTVWEMRFIKKLMFVKSDLCVSPEWTETETRLDVWHFMRRFGNACVSENHPLFPVFMRKLSEAIFEYNKDDLQQLIDAYREQFKNQLGYAPPTPELVLEQINRKTLLKCVRRQTK